MIDIDAIRKIAERNLENKLTQAFYEKGYCTEKISDMFNFITRLFKQIPPELIRWRVNCILFLKDFDYSSYQIEFISDIVSDFNQDATLFIVDEFKCVLLDYTIDFDGQSYIMYEYHGSMNECFHVDEKRITIDQHFDSNECSIFAIPTYKELDEALVEYDINRARNSLCSILAQVWEDDTRLGFCNKPEHYMRDSLWQFLKTALRSHTVLREQTVDALHPVDIKVTWPTINVLALIEIKWVGDSGRLIYRDSRANEGAKQLIDYLDASYCGEPEKYFWGYLVVFDGRRRVGDLVYYRAKGINYRTEHKADQRMKYYKYFLEPKLT